VTIHNTYPQLRYTVATDEPAHYQATELPCRATDLPSAPPSYRATELITASRYRAAIGRSPPRRTRALYNTVQYNTIPGQRGECYAHCNFGGANIPAAVAVLGRTKIPRITKSNQAEIEKRFKPRASNRGATIPLLALDIAPDLVSIYSLILGQISKACHKQARCVCAWLTQIRFSTSHREASRIGQVVQHQLAHSPETGAAMVRRPSQVNC
jgi:hypothetical protein